VLDAEQATVFAGTSQCPFPTDCDAGGRLLLGSNTAIAPPSIDLGTRVETFAGPSANNPYLVGNIATPYIPDLLGGAEIFGLLDGLTADDPLLAGFLGGAAGDAPAALLRLDSGIGKYTFDFTGYDMLLLISLGASAVANPMLGVDPSGADPHFLVPLMTGSAETAALFGGPGPSLLGTLDPAAIFATLIPEDGTTFNFGYTVDGDLFTASVEGLRDGVPVFLVGEPTTVPEPGTVALLMLALASLGVAARRRKTRCPAH
jgi:hypothetical protein